MKLGNNGGYANARSLGGANVNEIARLNWVRARSRRSATVSHRFNMPRTCGSAPGDQHVSDVVAVPYAPRALKRLMQQFSGKIDVESAKRFEADHYDETLLKDSPGSHSLCAHGDLDPQPAWPGSVPFNPSGTFDAKVVDSRMAKQMSFAARWGSACGTAFDAHAFLAAHPQFDWMEGILKDRPIQPWTEFQAGGKR
jgi:hypothetical protein